MSRRSCVRCRRACVAPGTTSRLRRRAETGIDPRCVRPPDAVILDLVLPDGRGTDVARELRAWSKAPIIVLSVVGDEARRSPRSMPAPTTMSRSRSASMSCSRGSAPHCGAPSRPRSRCSRSVVCASTSSARSHARRRTRPADAARVRAADAAGTERGQVADAQGDPARGLGRGLRRRVALPARLRLAAAAQARARSRSAAHDPHGAGRRLPARRSLERFLRRRRANLEYGLRLPAYRRSMALRRSIYPRPGKAALPYRRARARGAGARCRSATPWLAGVAGAVLFATAGTVRTVRARHELAAVRRTADRLIVHDPTSRDASDLVRWRCRELTTDASASGFGGTSSGSLRSLDPAKLPSASPLKRRPHAAVQISSTALAARLGDEQPVAARGMLLAQSSAPRRDEPAVRGRRRTRCSLRRSAA